MQCKRLVSNVIDGGVVVLVTTIEGCTRVRGHSSKFKMQHSMHVTGLIPVKLL